MRRMRGHVLVEVMISSAILLVGLEVLLGQLGRGSHDVQLASRDQLASSLAAQELDRLAQLPTAYWLAHAGLSLPPVSTGALGLPGGALQTVFGEVAVDVYRPSGRPGPPLAGARFVPVTVTASYCGSPPCPPATERSQARARVRSVDP